jgi:hypothetical protein
MQWSEIGRTEPVPVFVRAPRTVDPAHRTLGNLDSTSAVA